MSGTENQAPASAPLSPLAESHKSSRDSSPQIESSPLKPVTNVRVQTPEAQYKKRSHTPDFKVYNENAAFNNQKSPSSSPVRSPLCEKSSSVLSPSPTVVVPTTPTPEHGRRSPASTRPKSPPTITAKLTKPTPLTDKLRETVHDEDIKDQIADLRKQLQERTTRLDKLKQQKKDQDQELRDARSKTASLQKQLKEMKKDITNAETTLQREETDVQAIRERVRHIDNEIDDNQNIIQEFAKLTQEQDKEDADKEREIDDLMNLIPEKLVRIQELKLLLGEE